MADITITIQTGSTTITKTIDSADVAELKAGVLREYPNVSGQSDLQHILNRLTEHLFTSYENGTRKLAIEARVVNKNIIH